MGAFLRNDRAFKVTGTDRPVMMGIQQNDLLRDLFTGCSGDPPETGMFGKKRSINIEDPIMLDDRSQRYSDEIGLDNDIFSNLFH